MGLTNRARGRGAAVVVAAILALVVGAVVGAAIIVNRGSTTAQTGLTSAAEQARVPVSYVGYTWILTSVSTSGNVVRIPAEHPAWRVTMTFYLDDMISVDDSVNTHTGRQTASSDAFAVHDVRSTLVAYGGADATRSQAIEAIQAVLSGRQISVIVSDTRLVMTTEKYSLSFARGEIAKKPSNVPPSSSR
jgi:hypothetical protein